MYLCIAFYESCSHSLLNLVDKDLAATKPEYLNYDAIMQHEEIEIFGLIVSMRSHPYIVSFVHPGCGHEVADELQQKYDQSLPRVLTHRNPGVPVESLLFPSGGIQEALLLFFL